jgi:hypothetical protein
MKTYKLIKTYPGSPELETEVEKESNYKSSSSYFYKSGDKRICVFNDHVEENPEYWEVIEFYQEYMVSLTDMAFHNAWESRRVHGKNEDTDSKKYFKTKEEAEYFIVTNKPCLSYNDISEYAINFDNKGVYYKVYVEKLKELVKSRL